MKTLNHLMTVLAIVAMICLSNIPDTFAQGGVGINNDNSEPDNSAMLDVKSTTKGAIFPRMTHKVKEQLLVILQQVY